MKQKGKTFYFIGIGGIGMSALAIHLFDQGNKVMGYDKTPSTITSHLMDMGIPVTFDTSVAAIPKDYCQ